MYHALIHDIEQSHDKTYNKTCVPAKTQISLYPPSVARVIVYPSLDSPWAVERT